MGHFREKKWAVMPTEAESDPAVFDTAYGGICSERFENLSNHDFFLKDDTMEPLLRRRFPGPELLPGEFIRRSARIWCTMPPLKSFRHPKK